jgi:methyl-accepting chemotaxis protein
VFDEVFHVWLDRKANEIVQKMDKEKLSSEEMMVLVLKAQANHFAHLDQDLRSEMQALRQDTMREIALLREDMNRRFEQVDKRFEQVDKRFEQVDKRFEQVDKRFEQIDMRFNRIYVFLQWMMGVLATSAVAMLIKLYFG